MAETKVLAKLVGGTAHARREQRPAIEQRPPGNPEENKEGPVAVTEFDGEFVQSRDFITATERPEVLDEINDDMKSDEFQCDECDRTFKTERGKTAHMVAKHSDDGGDDSESDEDEEDIELMDEQAEADADATREATEPEGDGSGPVTGGSSKEAGDADAKSEFGSADDGEDSSKDEDADKAS